MIKKMALIFAILFFSPWIVVFAKTVEFPMGSGQQVEVDSKGNIISNFVEFILPTGLHFWAIQHAEADEPTIQEIIKVWADSFDVSYRQMNGTIRCESNYDNSARGKAGEIGIAQFMPKTFSAFEKEYGKDLDIYSAQNQIELMAFAFSTGKQNHWSCWRQLFR